MKDLLMISMSTCVGLFVGVAVEYAIMHHYYKTVLDEYENAIIKCVGLINKYRNLKTKACRIPVQKCVEVPLDEDVWREF